jgi:acyl carrier protein
MIDLESYIFNWIKTKFDVETPLTANFFEEGVLDSLSFAELIVVLEEHFQIEIDFADITDWEKVSSIKGLSDFLKPITRL